MKFSKMHGLGNDFVVIEKIKKNHLLNLSSKLIKKLSDRNKGIGFNQLLLIEKTNQLNCDFHYRIFNADGMEVEQCGNGARCIAMFLKLKKFVKKKKIKISTNTQNIEALFLKKKLISINMGMPNFDPISLPFIIKEKIKKKYKIKINNTYFTLSVVSIGNPHCILEVNKLEKTEVKKIGSLISNHEFFPQKVNVSFMEKINSTKIKLRVYERGVGETKACGTAACAAVAIGIRNSFLSNKKNIKVILPGGNLNIFWSGQEENPIFMTGPAIHVYDGVLNLKNFIKENN